MVSAMRLVRLQGMCRKAQQDFHEERMIAPEELVARESEAWLYRIDAQRF